MKTTVVLNCVFPLCSVRVAASILGIQPSVRVRGYAQFGFGGVCGDEEGELMFITEILYEER